MLSDERLFSAVVLFKCNSILSQNSVDIQLTLIRLDIDWLSTGYRTGIRKEKGWKREEIKNGIMIKYLLKMMNIIMMQKSKNKEKGRRQDGICSLLRTVLRCLLQYDHT